MIDRLAIFRSSGLAKLRKTTARPDLAPPVLNVLRCTFCALPLLGATSGRSRRGLDDSRRATIHWRADPVPDTKELA